MSKKTGTKAKYITHKINGKTEVEVKEIVNGYEMGISLSDNNNTYYTMIPKSLAGKGAKRSKLVWLKSDKENAVAKFYAIVSKLKGEQDNYIPVPKSKTKERDEIQELVTTKISTNPKTKKIRDKILKGTKFKDGDEISFYTSTPVIDIPEAHHILWLKRELQNPKELAKKTGIEAFNNFREWMLKNHITLDELYTNYKGSIKYSKIKDESTKSKTKKAWELFKELTDAVTVDAVTFEDSKAFEKILHDKGLADKTIHHYKNNVTKIFRYNFDKVYVGNTDIKQVLEYFNAWEDLDINSSDTIAAQAVSKQDFMTLYNEADKKGDFELKAVMMLCLNTGTYLREVARFKISDINMKEQTLMTQRNKTGRCKKFAFLWNRTVSDLKAYLATRKDASDVLFKANHGGEYIDGGGLRTRFWALRDDTKLGKKALGDNRVEFQHLRDTFQTIADEQGITTFHSNMVMGHSTGKTKERYSHRRIHNELREACLAVEKGFFQL